MRTLREQLGLDRAGFAAAVGAGPYSVGRWEGGHQLPRPRVRSAVRALAAARGVALVIPAEPVIAGLDVPELAPACSVPEAVPV